MTDKKTLKTINDIRKQSATRGDADAYVIGIMLDALAAALRNDMEQGAAWMNEAATTEFERKYPRFVMLFNNARRIDWSRE